MKNRKRKPGLINEKLISEKKDIKNPKLEKPLSYDEKLKLEEREKLKKRRRRENEEKRRKKKYYEKNIKQKTSQSPKKKKKKQLAENIETQKVVKKHKNPIEAPVGLAQWRI